MHKQMQYKNLIQIIPIICTFSYGFFEKFLGLPLRWEIEFSIDLVIGTQPISKPTYPMDQAKHKELGHQIAALWEKRSIRPSNSPWGALVLFAMKKDGILKLCID